MHVWGGSERMKLSPAGVLAWAWSINRRRRPQREMTISHGPLKADLLREARPLSGQALVFSVPRFRISRADHRSGGESGARSAG